MKLGTRILLLGMQLLDLFSDPDRDIDRIVELVSNDPALMMWS